MGPQACAGSDVAEIARSVFEDSGVSINCREEVVNRDRVQALGDELLRGTLPAGMLLTAIPLTACATQVTGNTFVALFTKDAIHIVDSHRHHTPAGTRGFVWARCSSWAQMLDWVFRPTGLLEQLASRSDLLEAVVLGVPQTSAPECNPEAGQLDAAVAPCRVPDSAVLSVAAAIAEQGGGEAYCEVTDNQQCRHHAVFRSQCEECRWAKHSSKWQASASYVEKSTFKNFPMENTHRWASQRLIYRKGIL